jgi:hypothetical protein
LLFIRSIRFNPFNRFAVRYGLPERRFVRDFHGTGSVRAK